MTTALSRTAAGLAKNDAARSCGEVRKKLRTNEIIAETARRVFPHKTALYVQEITGFPARTVEYWLSGSGKIPSDALGALLRSEYGVQFLTAVMHDAQPTWWRRVVSYFATLDAMAMQRKARRKLREAIDADTETSAAIARADAYLVQDEDFYRPNADAVRAVAGVPHRTMAAAMKRR